VLRENGLVADENVDVVHEALNAIRQRDLSAFLKQLDGDVVLHPLLTVWQRTYRGHEGIEQWWGDVDEVWEDFTLEAKDFRDVGEGILLVRLDWRGRAKGAPVELDGPAAAVVRFRENKVVSIDVHLDEGHALRALSPR
jgi:ketosteroid isomerase-like protein